MKKFFLAVSFSIFLLAIFSNSSSAQMVVRVRPAAPVIARPVAPSPVHIWVDGNWMWRGGKYVYANGYWAQPRRGYRYVPGHWKHTFRGWIWRPGLWRR